MNKILVTGGAGFIGSNFVLRYLKEHPQDYIINVDSLTYAGNLENLKEVESNERYAFEKADICDREAIRAIVEKHDINIIVNFAAESHVDRSITGPAEFIRTNINGTFNLLEIFKEKREQMSRYLQVSTDEVYGSLGAEGYFIEETPLAPNSPYSSSKASADMLVRAYYHTFNLPVLTTRCSNNYGPYQFPEKLIPLMIINALNGKKLPVYGDGKNVRDWLHVSDHCKAIDTVLHNAEAGSVYNIGGNNEMMNIDIVKLILKHLGKSEDLIEFVTDRPGHDRRYAIDASKIKKDLGWEPSYTFEKGIGETIDWYLNNKEWWEKIISGDYMKYYETQYKNR